MQSFCNATTPPELYTGKDLGLVVLQFACQLHSTLMPPPPNPAGIELEMFRQLAQKYGYIEGEDYVFKVRAFAV